MFLYVAVGSLVVARLLLYPLRPADLTPPYCAVDGAIHVMTTVLATLPADHGCSDDHRGALFFLSINELTRCAAVTG